LDKTAHSKENAVVRTKVCTTFTLAGLLLSFWGVSLAAAGNLGDYLQGGSGTLAGPAYEWWYGCSPTSAGMMMGYYDQYGYGGKSYANLVPAGRAENTTTNSGSTGWDYKVNNIIASYDYVTTYYRKADGTPDYTNGGTGAGYNIYSDDASSTQSYNCLAYYMGTSQDAAGNSNGSTTFYYFTDGAKFTAQDAYFFGVWKSDGMYGMDEYFRSCGYGVGGITTDTTFYTQAIYSESTGKGFSFTDYVAEIIAGRVVMIQVEGHSMFGYGYKDDTTGQWILFHNTWDDAGYYMLWGTKYEDMAQWGVVCFEPTGGSAVPLPGAVWLLGSGLLGLGGWRRLRKS
jgi:hypothetical protein